jgi:hypothetical protein
MNFQSRARNHSERIPGQEKAQGFQRSHIDESTDMSTPLDVACAPMRSDEASFNLNHLPQFPPFGTVGSWDPSEMAFMNMIDDRTASWSAEYLTDGQSGVDPFLFPF